MRLIDADHLLARKNGVWDSFDGVYDWTDIPEILESEPTVDAVPVVRCKDCERSSYDVMFNERYCHGKLCKDNDFCSRGKRKII